MFLVNFCLFFFILFFVFSENIGDDFKAALKEKDPKNKIKIYDRIINKDANANFAYFNRGIEYLKLKSWTEAKLDFKKHILLTNINKEKALNNIAICEFNLKEYDEAIKIWDNVLIISPDNNQYLVNKINALIKINKINEALNLLNEKIKKGGNNELYLLRANVFEKTKDLESELADINAYLKNERMDKEVLYRRANVNFKLKNYKEAKKDFVYLCKNNFRDSHYKLSIVEYYLNDYEASLKYIEKYILEKPNDIEALKLSVSLYILLKQNSNALNALDKLISLDETNWDMFLKRALIYLEQNNHNDALKDLNVYISARPNDALARLKRAQIYELTGKVDLSISDIISATNNSKDSSHLKQLAIYCINKERYSDAILILTKILKNNSSDPEIFFLRGISYFNKQEYEAAIYDFSETLKRKKDHEKALYNRAGIFMFLKQYQSAKCDYMLLIELVNNSSEYFLKLAISEYYLNEIELSRESYKKAKKLDLSLPEYEYYFSDFNL